MQNISFSDEKKKKKKWYQRYRRFNSKEKILPNKVLVAVFENSLVSKGILQSSKLVVQQYAMRFTKI